ncbi:hypothetical protein VPNG_02895 [Cytospora leucostoma]|uniref:C2H2-type domain-containing protein n=1 Tax=Cytospora leucostoma TaxID=1230097 RepID=A0A423XJR7_9PEZI|nr:hypothetical protein VPNG_02895 [Cytospora leucostoma]
MTLSPFKTVSLPSLKPGQISPAASSKEQSIQSKSSSLKVGRTATNLLNHDIAAGKGTGRQSSPKPAPSQPRILKQTQQHSGYSLQDAPLSHRPSLKVSGAGRSASKKSQNTKAESSRQQGQQEERLPSRDLHFSKGAQLSVGTSSNQPATNSELIKSNKPAKDHRFFFRLTDEELRNFKKRHRNGSTLTGLSDLAIAQELNRLGRGWKGFDRASREAEDEGRLDQFMRRIQTERWLMSTGLPLPEGAISMQAAVDAVEGGINALAKWTERCYSYDTAKTKGSRELSRRAIGLRLGTAACGGTGSSAPSDQSDKGFCDHTRDRHTQGSTPAPLKPDEADVNTIPPDSTNQDQPQQLVETSESDFQPRQHGRPKGSKNETNSLTPLVDRPRPRRVQARPDYRIRRIRERQPNAPLGTPRDCYDLVEPHFPQFMCEWTGCKAILNNTTNLRKHVGIVHGQEARETLCCSWGKCGRDDSIGVFSAFASIEGLEDHLQTLHLDSIKWHLGDGRRGQGIVLDESALGDTSYLFWNGRQVTPSIRNQKIETPAEWRARKDRVRNFLLEVALNASSESEDTESGD